VAQAITYVKDAERMITKARLTRQGILVRFADDREGLIPLERLELGAEPRELKLPSPYLLEIHLEDGRREELPWDYVRAFVDPEYQGPRSRGGSSRQAALGGAAEAAQGGGQAQSRGARGQIWDQPRDDRSLGGRGAGPPL
jgi:hypothetical protein